MGGEGGEGSRLSGLGNLVRVVLAGKLLLLLGGGAKGSLGILEGLEGGGAHGLGGRGLGEGPEVGLAIVGVVPGVHEGVHPLAIGAGGDLKKGGVAVLSGGRGQ